MYARLLGKMRRVVRIAALVGLAGLMTGCNNPVTHKPFNNPYTHRPFQSYPLQVVFSPKYRAEKRAEHARQEALREQRLAEAAQQREEVRKQIEQIPLLGLLAAFATFMFPCWVPGLDHPGALGMGYSWHR